VTCIVKFVTVPLHQLIADRLRGSIRDGSLAIGDPLPSESQLRAEWGASRGPVRQALAALRAERLIEGGQGRRAVVAAPALGQPFDTLLSFSAWATSIGRTPGQRTLGFDLRPADVLAASRLGVDEGEPVAQELRLRLLDGDPVMLERTTYVERVGRLLLDFDTDSGSEWEHLESHGVHLARAGHVIDAVAADDLDAEHLRVEVGAPLLRQRRTARTAEGEAVEFDDDRYVPGAITFTLENSALARATVG
jgi:GntR family transcriptional regulator